MTWDVVVVGAGIGGLAAASDSAAAGLRTLVLEADAAVGGKAGTAEADGVTFDTGPSVLTLPHVFDQVLRRAGTSLDAEVTLVRPEPATRYLWPDGQRIDVWPSVARTLDEVRSARGDVAARELQSFLSYAETIWNNAAPWFVEGDAPTPSAFVRLLPAVFTALPWIDPLRTMDGALRRRVTDPAVRDMLRRFATYNGSDPRKAPATLHCIAHVELTAGVFGVEGGISALVGAMLRGASRAGATVRTGAAVRRVLSDGRVRGVELNDGEQITASAVIVNADVAHLRADLAPAADRHLPRAGEPSTSGWTAVLRARRRGDRPAHTVLFPENYAEEFVDLFDRRRAPANPTVYLCAQEKAHRRSGWADHEPLFVMANAPAQPDEDGGDWQGLRAKVLMRLHHAGLIDPDDAIAWERTPAELASRFVRSRGSIYGSASNDAFAAFRRPPNRVAGLPGLYLASGGAHPGGGLPLCCLSGQAAARAVVEDHAGSAPRGR